MSVNFARNVLNKCLFNYKNNFNQMRLKSMKVAQVKESDTSLVVNKVNEIKKLGKNKIRVQVYYCSLNKIDVDLFKKNKNANYVPGYEFTGEVLEIGSNVKPELAKVGERVAVLSKNRGGFAEQCVVDSVDVWKLPSEVKLKDAAVIIYAHTNALYAFSHLSNIKENTKILIGIGPAGIGLAAVDVAANIYKAKPVGVCLSEELSAVVRERGAFKTTTFKNKKLIKEFSNSDIIYDAMGGEYHKLIAGCIKPGGEILYAGPEIVDLPPPPPNSKLSVVNIESLRTTNVELYRNSVQETLDLAEEGMISAYVSAEYKLDDINSAIQFIEDKKCTGKVLIKIIAD